jgi:hypothetical protein
MCSRITGGAFSFGFDGFTDALLEASVVADAASFDDSAPADELAVAFLRALNENFFGGLKELRAVCSFSARSLIF